MKEKIVKKNLISRFSFLSDKNIFSFLLLAVLTVLFLTSFVYQAVQNSNLKKQVNEMKEKINAVTQITARTGIVYVYSMDTLITKSPEVLAFQTDYNKKVADLTAEIEEAGKKIKNFKNEKVKEDFSELYLQSLIAKRNDLVGNYQQKLQEITSKINQALENVMNANNIPAVFDSKVLLGRSNKVIDITDVVLQNFEELIKAK